MKDRGQHMDYIRHLAQLNAGYCAAREGTPFSSCMSNEWQQGYKEYVQLREKPELSAKRKNGAPTS
jgi:hypothetical protein